MLFICLVVANICLDGDTKAVDADGSRRSLAATKVSGKIFVVFIVGWCIGRGFFTSWLLPTPNKYNAAGESYPRYGMRIRHVCAVVLQRCDVIFGAALNILFSMLDTILILRHLSNSISH